jgi:hypothetical protein
MASNENPARRTARRRAAWAAGAGLLAVVAGGAWLLSHRAPPPAPVAAAAAPVPRPATAAEPATESAAAAVPERRTEPSPAPASAAVPKPAAPPRPMAAQVEEAMREVQWALNGTGTPQQMLDAAMTLSSCGHADEMVASAERMRDQPLSPENRELQKAVGEATGMPPYDPLPWAQEMQRRCREFDAATLARSGELLRKAWEGGAEHAALGYLQWLNRDGRQQGTPELRARLQGEARQSAEAGDFQALMAYSYAFDPAPLGATPLQRQAYKEALFRIQKEQSGEAMEQASRASMASLEKLTRTPELSAEQQREADAMAARVVDAWRRRQGRGG